MSQQTSPSEFEQSLERLQKIVATLEQGEMSLQDSLKAFEQGIQLSASCEQTLNLAEQRIEQILDDSQEASEATSANR